MATAGRGRGRGRGATSVQPLRKPGRSPLGSEGDVPEPSNGSTETYISSLLKEPINIKQITETCKMYATDSKRMDGIAKEIHQKAMCNSDFASVGAELCQNLANHEVDGMKFRTCVLRLVQSDYKERDVIQCETPEKFLCCISFLCQVFDKVQITSGEPLKPLVSPVCDYLDGLLEQDATEKDVECCFKQLKDIGAKLETCDKSKLDELFVKIRAKIMIGSNPKMRSQLLQLIELRWNKWEPLPEDIMSYYAKTAKDFTVNGK